MIAKRVRGVFQVRRGILREVGFGKRRDVTSWLLLQQGQEVYMDFPDNTFSSLYRENRLGPVKRVIVLLHVIHTGITTDVLTFVNMILTYLELKPFMIDGQ